MRSISASSIEKWNTCQRRWVWNYHYNLREEAGPAAEAGKRVHALLEKAQENEPEQGVTWGGYDISRMAKALWERIPNDDTVLGYEVEFQKSVHGVTWKGVVDRLSDKRILDHKTTGSDLKWAKTSKKLQTDVQRLIYSEVYPDVESALWITGSWKTFEVREGLLLVDREADREHFKLHVLTPAEEMLTISEGTDPLSLPLPPKGKSRTSKPEACNKFNVECPFTSKCFPEKKKLSTFLEKLKQEMPEQKEVVITNTSGEETVVALPGLAPEPVVKFDYLVEHLYIDCLPMHSLSEPITFGYEVIGAASREVAKDMGVLNPLLIDFGKGPHMVVAELIAQLDSRESPIKHLYVESKSTEGRACIQELSARSRYVFKGVY